MKIRSSKSRKKIIWYIYMEIEISFNRNRETLIKKKRKKE